MRKKLLTVTLFTAMMMSLAACGSESNTTTEVTTTTSTEASSEVLDTTGASSEETTESSETVTDANTTGETTESEAEIGEKPAREAADTDDSVAKAENAYVLSSDKNISFEGVKYTMPFTLSDFMTNTGTKIDEDDVENIKADIEKFGHSSAVLKSEKDGNSVGIIVSLVDYAKDGSAVSDITTLSVGDIDIDAKSFKSSVDEEYKKTHPVVMPGGATWDSTYADLLGIYGIPDSSFEMDSGAKYYEFKFIDDDGKDYELKAFFDKDGETPYRYFYTVVGDELK